MNTLQVNAKRVCPTKLVEQAHRQTDLIVDGFSDIPEQPTVCNERCPGPVIPKPGIIRQIGNRLLPSVIPVVQQTPACPRFSE